MNTLAQTAGSVPLWVETSAADAAAGTAEVFDPENLTVSGVVLDLQADAGQAQAILPQIQAKMAEMPLCLTAEISGAPAEELQTLKSAADNGVSAVVLTENNRQNKYKGAGQNGWKIYCIIRKIIDEFHLEPSICPKTPQRS